jgi:RNA recognition motif-containing protein
MKLLIRNLARTTTEAELLALFKTHGKVQYCNLVLDLQSGKSKGFAFVEMPREGEAKAAMRALNGTSLAGNKIRVKKAKSKSGSDTRKTDVKNPVTERISSEAPGGSFAVGRDADGVPATAVSGKHSVSVTNEVEIERWNSAFAQRWVEFQTDLDACLSSVSDKLIERAALVPGERVVDVGCGAGATTIEVARQVGPGGRVLAIDVSEPMLDVARKRMAGSDQCEFLLSDAQTHAFEQGAFDALLSRFGVMFFDDPVAAFANMSLALRPGGRVVFASWAAVGKNPWFQIPRDAAIAQLGTPEPVPPRAPGPMAFSETDYVKEILTRAGLTYVRADQVSLELVNSGGLNQAAELASNLGPAARIHKEKNGTAEDLDKIRTAVTEKFRQYESDSGVTVPATINYFTAVRSLAVA